MYADWDIRSNVIQPGWIEKDFDRVDDIESDRREGQGHMLKNTVLLRRTGKGEDIAYAAAVPGERRTSSYITGTDIVVRRRLVVLSALPDQRTLAPHAQAAGHQGKGQAHTG